MDKINAFLGKRKLKNKKIYKIEDKEYLITREDLKTIKKYQNNECLDNIQLYLPNNTKYSSAIKEEPIKKAKLRKQMEHKIKLKKNVVKKRKSKKEKLIFTDVSVKNQTWFNNIEAYDNSIPFIDLKGSFDDYTNFLDKLVKIHFTPHRIKTKLIKPEIKIDCSFPTQIGKFYDFKTVFAQENELVIRQTNFFELFNLKNNLIIKRLKDLECFNSFFIEKMFFYSSENVIYKNENNFTSELFIFNNKIEQFVVSEKYLAFVSQNNVFLKNFQTNSIKKFSKKKYLKLEFYDRKLFLHSKNELKIYNLETKKAIKISGISSYSVSEYILVSCGMDLVLYKKGKPVHRLYQLDFIKQVVLHRKIPLAAVVMKNELRIFYYSNEGFKLCKVFSGKFRNIFFNSENHFCYAEYGDRLVVLI